MEKEALAAKSLLKALAIGGLGAGAVGGAGYGGYRYGAKRATNEMASAFSEANARENNQIVSSFKLFNKKENRAIQQDAFKKGVVMGAHMHASGRIQMPTSVEKRANALEQVYHDAFNDEFEKEASVGGSFKRLFRGGKLTLKRLMQMKGETSRGKRTALMAAGRAAKHTLAGGKTALGITAGGVGTAALGGKLLFGGKKNRD